jgi:hypothetical protein
MISNSSILKYKFWEELMMLTHLQMHQSLYVHDEVTKD